MLRRGVARERAAETPLHDVGLKAAPHQARGGRDGPCVSGDTGRSARSENAAEVSVRRAGARHSGPAKAAPWLLSAERRAARVEACARGGPHLVDGAAARACCPAVAERQLSSPLRVAAHLVSLRALWPAVPRRERRSSVCPAWCPMFRRRVPWPEGVPPPRAAACATQVGPRRRPTGSGPTWPRRRCLHAVGSLRGSHAASLSPPGRPRTRPSTCRADL